MEKYRLLAECLLPEHMLDWFDLNPSLTLYGNFHKISAVFSF